MADEQKPKTTFQLIDKDIPILDRIEETPSIYIDGMQGIVSTQGVSRIGLFEYRQDIRAGGEITLKKVIVGRLILPTAMLGAVAKWIGEQAAKIETTATPQKEE